MADERSTTAEEQRLGQVIRAARERKGLTQIALARRIGVSGAQISRIESGVRPIFVKTWMAIAAELDLLDFDFSSVLDDRDEDEVVTEDSVPELQDEPSAA